MSKTPQIIIIAGPCGVGKTTVATLLTKSLNADLVSGDVIKSNLFPEIGDIREHPDKLTMVKEEIFQQGLSYFNHGRTVVIDYVILGRTYIERFRKTFKNDLFIQILYPNPAVTFQRDQARVCWTSGQKAIDKLYAKYKNLEEYIGSENYIDNGQENPKQTVERILQRVKS